MRLRKVLEGLSVGANSFRQCAAFQNLRKDPRLALAKAIPRELKGLPVAPPRSGTLLLCITPDLDQAGRAWICHRKAERPPAERVKVR